MRLANMNWKQAEAYFQTHDMVVLTTGSIECHGLHNPLGTDTLIPMKLLDLIEEKFKVRLPEDEAGFITHLKFFAKRLVERNIYTEDDNDDLWEVIRGKYPGAFGCVEKITQFIGKKYEYGLSKEEQLYLTIHVERVVNKTKQ